MGHLHQYVPMSLSSGNATVPHSDVTEEHLHPLLFGGDQLTAARARVSLLIRRNSTKPSTCFEGLIPVCEDWHTKVVFLRVSSL